MRRETQNILLVLLGGALLKLALSGTYLRYVKESLQPWLVVTGGIMIVLAVVSIARDLKAGREAAEGHVEDGGHEGHVGHEGHEHGKSRSPWMLLLPVLAVFLISPPALGADTVNRSDRNAAQQAKAGSGFAALPSDEVVPLTISEFVTRTAWDDSGSLNNRTVRLTGFVVRKESNTYLARLTISCCAADASPVKTLMVGQDFTGLPNDQWVEATGKVVPGSATKDNAYVPTFTVESLNPITPPEDTYEG
ncbi:TIGR03943 family putative permease subunit [Saccharothrix variisporea]|uniref:Putative repeat protein (TIGR03943 family) n=1 Tax=Saccharothrix variisporea TaxID=543527 RepID=A0A495X8P8_9PSEU|nr:TIGR03943 family protein [Saccharothrix variisporea]RKT69989.1 putative repeat protein (TIGR03943 family) [Saccharothrix variisporea]